MGGKVETAVNKPDKAALLAKIPTASPPKKQKTPKNKNEKSKRLRDFEDEGIDDNPEVIQKSGFKIEPFEAA